MRVRNTKFLLNRSLVGWNGNFALAMRPFDPSAIFCEDRTADPPFGDDCDEMVQTMPAGLNDHDTFGPAGAPGVTAALPFFHSTDRKILSFSKCCQD